MFHRRCDHRRGGGHHDGHHGGRHQDGEGCHGRSGRRFARSFGGRHFGRHQGGEGHHGRGGGRGRVFDHGDLRFVILHLIADKPSHGYELIKAIEEKLAGAYSPSPGVIYPTLTMLEEMGYATVSASEGGKKLYAATAEGLAFLEASKPSVDAVLARMAEVSASHGGGPAPQILRAFENLKMALRLRTSRGALTEDEIRVIAEIVDAAAIAVERS